MKIRYLTIEREYGSAGTEIAAQVGRRCGIPSYSREILETVARRQNLPVEALNAYEESVSSSLVYSMFVMSQSQTGDPDLLSPEAKLYVAETRVIRELAARGPAVFVGHCAAQVLKDEPGVVRVFIRADEETKRRRIRMEYGIAPQEVEAVQRRFDRKRANYYAFCTRKKWNDLSQYDLVLDSSALGVDKCAALLSALYQD